MTIDFKCIGQNWKESTTKWTN